MNTTLRRLATPIAIGSFTISAITGILIFFDIEMGMIEPVHKWLSWLLLGGVALHTLSNWKPFAGYFSKKPALLIIGTAVVITVASVLPVFGEKEEEGKRGGKAFVQALESSSLQTVALVLKSSPEELATRLGKRGITVNDTSLSITEIARLNGKEGGAVLGALLSGPGGESNGEER
jgi:hypothetical protein